MSEINIEEIINQLKTAASESIGKDVNELRGFGESQVQALAQQTKIVAIGIKSGEITEATREFFLDGLEDMALNLAKTIRGLMMVSIEKAWNAMVNVLYEIISKISGIALMAP